MEIKEVCGIFSELGTQVAFSNRSLFKIVKTYFQDCEDLNQLHLWKWVGLLYFMQWLSSQETRGIPAGNVVLHWLETDL